MRTRKTIFLASLSTLMVASLAHAAFLAKVGSREITMDDIRKEYGALTQQQKDAVNKDSTTRKGMVDNLVNAELLVQAAGQAGMDRDDEYKEAIDRFRRQYLASRFMQKAIEPKLGTSDVKKFFNDNKTMFDTTQVCAHHVLLSSEEDAAKVLADVKKDPKKFETIAKEKSIDPSAKENSGNLGCFTRDRMVPEFSAAAFKARKGQIEGPVRSNFGFHVIMVDDIRAGKVPGYDEVEQYAKEAYRSKLVQDLIQDLRKKSKVEVNDSAVKTFKI